MLREEKVCRWCGSPANSVDHILPRAWGGTHDRSNLQALCSECRKKKDIQDAAEGRRRSRGV
ncbi:HNH endonuclease [Candidatus Contubernalis alkaliaceticus]|uniref:HNH endonuclease n=1 Tax=Candidatus Contubernalis alkaliaceticus TaxID=338645 RepID=UPI001F4C4519|nr:HNH endonuclease [Candidatus Contubernalis alkalaceticus]